VGSRAGLDGCGRSRPPPGFDPRTVQPVAILNYRHNNTKQQTHWRKWMYYFYAFLTSAVIVNRPLVGLR
jgi:hypothetical protein